MEKSKHEQLAKLKKDLGHGESVAMDTIDHLSQPSVNPEISLGAGDEMGENDNGEEVADEQQEQDSFQRFLSREHEKSSSSRS